MGLLPPGPPLLVPPLPPDKDPLELLELLAPSDDFRLNIIPPGIGLLLAKFGASVNFDSMSALLLSFGRPSSPKVIDPRLFSTPTLLYF